MKIELQYDDKLKMYTASLDDSVFSNGRIANGSSEVEAIGKLFTNLSKDKLVDVDIYREWEDYSISQPVPDLTVDTLRAAIATEMLSGAESSEIIDRAERTYSESDLELLESIRKDITNAPINNTSSK